MRYILVEWPESQYFIGHEKCYLCEELDSAYFVPEDLLKEIKKRLIKSDENLEIKRIYPEEPKEINKKQKEDVS